MTSAPTTTVQDLNKTLEAPPLDPVVLAIANDYLAGKSVEEMSNEYAVSQDRITSVIEQKDVLDFQDIYSVLKTKSLKSYIVK